MQSSVNNNTNLWETAAGTGYTNNAWPTSSTTTLTLNYYDTYTFPGNPYGPWNTSATAPRGLLTGNKTAVLNTPGVCYGRYIIMMIKAETFKPLSTALPGRDSTLQHQ